MVIQNRAEEIKICSLVRTKETHKVVAQITIFHFLLFVRFLHWLLQSRPLNTMIGIHRIYFKVFILIAILLRLSMGSLPGVALTEKKIRMSEEGTLIYGSLSNGEKSQLFMDYMKKFDREVNASQNDNFVSSYVRL